MNALDSIVTPIVVLNMITMGSICAIALGSRRGPAGVPKITIDRSAYGSSALSDV
jgi:hypothetical protein